MLHNSQVPREYSRLVFRRVLFLGVLAFILAISLISIPGTSKPAQAAPNWVLQFSDEFNGAANTGLNTANWKYDTGQGIFGTGEIETMTTSTANVYQDGSGHLIIKAIRDGSGNWTSGRIETQRSDFAAPAGGMLAMESSIQQPNVSGAAAAGYWPAFWMLGAGLRTGGTWPGVGEWDVLEDINGLSSVFGTLHCGVDPGGPCNETTGMGSGQRACAGCQTGLHTYRIEYDKTVSPEQLRWYLDGVNYFTINSSQLDATTWNNAVNRANFIIYDLAMGGGFPAAFGGGPTASTQSGAAMVIDYVRVYTSSSSGTPTPPLPTPTHTNTPVATSTGGCGTTNAALNKPATSSSNENATLTPNLAVDGNTGTRWSSAFSDPQWLQVDLGSTQSICHVKLTWEAAYAKSYQIQVSNDATNWTSIYSTTTGAGGVNDLTGLSGSGRYVRMNGTVRGTPYGYSLWEFEVYTGSGGGATNTPTFVPPTNTPGSGGNGNTFYVRSGGSLSTTAGSSATTATVASAGGGNHDGTVTNPQTFTISGLTSTYNGSGNSSFDAFVDSGIAVGNGVQVKISYDFTGDGTWDRTETYHYYATDPVVGFEDYNQTSAGGLESSTGSYANLSNGKVKIEVWNAIGNASSTLRVDASASNGQQSKIIIPFH